MTNRRIANLDDGRVSHLSRRRFLDIAAGARDGGNYLASALLLRGSADQDGR